MINPKREITKIEDYGKYYSHVTWCKNCGKRNYCYIPKGTERSKCNGIVCSNCGCNIGIAPEEITAAATNLRNSGEYWEYADLIERLARENELHRKIDSGKVILQQAECIAELEQELSKFQKSEFHPDWSLLKASQDSLREHMVLLGNAQQRITELEAQISMMKWPDETLAEENKRLDAALAELKSENWDGNEPMSKWMDRCDAIIEKARAGE